MIRQSLLASATMALLARISALETSEPKMTLPDFLQRMQNSQEFWKNLSEKPSQGHSPAGDIVSDLFMKGLFQESAEAARRLQRRPVQPEYLEPCFFDGDGCTNCWVDAYYQLAEWDCPDFCGKGHDFHGHVSSTLDETQDKYVADDAVCELDGCLPITEHHCYAFADNPNLVADDPYDVHWSCSELCIAPQQQASTTISGGSRGDTALAPDVERGSDLQGNFSILWLSLLVVGGIAVMAVVAVSLDCCGRGNTNHLPIQGTGTKDFVEGIPGSSTMSDDSSEVEGSPLHC